MEEGYNSQRKFCLAQNESKLCRYGTTSVEFAEIVSYFNWSNLSPKMQKGRLLDEKPSYQHQ